MSKPHSGSVVLVCPFLLDGLGTETDNGTCNDCREQRGADNPKHDADPLALLLVARSVAGKLGASITLDLLGRAETPCLYDKIRDACQSIHPLDKMERL